MIKSPDPLGCLPFAKVKIGAFTYSVTLESLEGALEHDHYGKCHPDRQCIILYDWGRERVATALLHEVLHVMWEHSGFGMKPPSGDFEEEAVTVLSFRIAEFAAQNPEVWTWIGDSFKKT